MSGIGSGSAAPLALRRATGLLATGLVLLVLVGCSGAGTSGSSSAFGADRVVPRLYLIGDSWAAGLHADPQHALGQVAAARLGWSVTVDAVSGTGYLNDGGTSGSTYAIRAASIPAGTTADVVVVQGGSNDTAQPLAQLPEAVDATVEAVQRRVPGARIVLLGPGPDPYPVTTTIRLIDTDLAAEALKLHVTEISMLKEQWITAANLGAVIDAGNAHPTVSGQVYLGERLAADLRTLGAGAGG